MVLARETILKPKGKIYPELPVKIFTEKDYQ
jgi:hypothetical protein